MQQRGGRVDEVRVVTTLGGRGRLLAALLDPARGEFFRFCRDYRIGPSSIKFDETTVALLRAPGGRSKTYAPRKRTSAPATSCASSSAG